MESMMTSINGHHYINNSSKQRELAIELSQAYPFVELLYSVDEAGVQTTESAYAKNVSDRHRRNLGIGSDRSERPYMIAAKESKSRVIITKPYLSNITHKLSISSIQHVNEKNSVDSGYLVININLQRLINYLSGNELANKITPWFKIYYGTIGVMLIAVALLLVYASVKSMYFALASGENIETSSFSIVVMITLGMSIFDLGKTILEEEVLFDKSMGHHETTQRTISRFMTAIIIAVSIEALLLMFKSLFNDVDGRQLMNAVWMLMSSVAMLVALGVFNFLSSNSKKDIQ
ncbi:hypothetical protein [Halomonas icarae]|nr:hypothetical protein [Halomonas icarae]MDR5903560.1 hypothetical protein [Halomonas icarae]